MFDLLTNSLRLYLQGRLFQNPGSVARQLALGITIGVLLMVTLALTGLPLWLAVLSGSIAAGGIQPFLFKNLKFA